MKILYISPVPFEGAGCRFRIHQYIPYLSKRGFKCTVSPFLFKAFFRIAYRKGMFLQKAAFFIISCLRRIFDLLRAFRYDAVIIYREAFPFGPALFESILHLFGKPIIFDFDDAIFLPDASDVNRMLLRFRLNHNPDKTIRMSRLSIAGNSYLREYALKYNKNAVVIPTVIDTEKFTPSSVKMSKKIVVGWIGTISTQKYLFSLNGVFRELSRKYPDLEIRVIGAQPGFMDTNNIVYKNWSLGDEIKDIQEFTIGIMPLPDNEWAKGKCGFKIIQYMACAVPAVASGIGNNNEIIRDGVNGFLVNSQEEWIRAVSSLVESEELRCRIGLAGRSFVEDNYSLKRYAPAYFDAIAGALNES